MGEILPTLNNTENFLSMKTILVSKSLTGSQEDLTSLCVVLASTAENTLP